MHEEEKNDQTASQTANEQLGMKFRSTSGGSVVVRDATEEETKEVNDHAQLAKKRSSRKD